jgi:limonene-1,2-epoxide hydrolase
MEETYVLGYYSQELFNKPYKDVEQWELLTIRALESCMIQGTSRKATVLKREMKDFEKMGIEGHAEHFQRYRVFVENLDEKRVN